MHGDSLVFEGFDGVLPVIICDYDAGNQPNIHPGSITSTGRQRVGPGTATSTQAAQLIGGGISPTLFTSPVSMHMSNVMFLLQPLIQNKIPGGL